MSWWASKSHMSGGTKRDQSREVLRVHIIQYPNVDRAWELVVEHYIPHVASGAGVSRIMRRSILFDDLISESCSSCRSAGEMTRTPGGMLGVEVTHQDCWETAIEDYVDVVGAGRGGDRPQKDLIPLVCSRSIATPPSPAPT
ncbi:hypothetical protein EVAR_89128_1 [Eumeta japonica]|uniref:Uncharacterized protein n=1 Tax=Eumeta variegata TaxID=151549 RepID=A0A4C1ZNE4_EUMVA|nr:hypothetical protein EVAR_89128_1 [Eumeta japonica]